MHPDPQFPEGSSPDNAQHGGMLYGVEYENSGSVDKNFNADAGCAVCEHESASSVYVQWGRKTCSNGHKTVYYGLIMANKYTAYKSEYICVDWERAPWSGSKAPGVPGHYATLYTTEWWPIDYADYKQGRELSCAVCSPEPGSVVYTRWGSKKCPSGATELYTSFMAGSRQDAKGNGVNYLCVHPEPEYPEGVGAPINVGGALLSPVQYKDNFVIKNVIKNNNQEAACTVCEKKNVMSVYTQWGIKTCPSDQQLEYHGIIMSTHLSNTKAEFVCVDEEIAFHAASRSADDFHFGRLYHSEMQNGAAGDQYGNDKEVSCAVCSSAKPVYTRFGAKTCPEGSTKLYDSFMATSYHSHSGSGYNYLCMHPQPEWPEGMNAGNQDAANIFGVEYRNTGTIDKNHDGDAACAVCQGGQRVPYVQWGRTTCSNDQTSVYTGLIMTSEHTLQPNEWVCVDWERAVHDTSKSTSENSGHLYTSEMEEGSKFGLDIYASNHKNPELACVVCV